MRARLARWALLCMAGFCTPGFAADSPPPHAPGFRLPTQRGSVSLDSLQGKVVYVDFWASWCVPCGKSFPWLQSVQDKYRSRGLVVVAINLDKEREAALEFLQAHPSKLLVAFDPEGTAALAYRVPGMPSSARLRSIA